MAMIGGLDLHRRQITFDTLETVSGEEWRGRIWQPDGVRFRRWLRDELAPRACDDPVALAVEGCTGWRYVVEEITAARFVDEGTHQPLGGRSPTAERDVRPSSAEVPMWRRQVAEHRIALWLISPAARSTPLQPAGHGPSMDAVRVPRSSLPNWPGGSGRPARTTQARRRR
jgi:transposase